MNRDRLLGRIFPRIALELDLENRMAGKKRYVSEHAAFQNLHVVRPDGSTLWCCVLCRHLNPGTEVAWGVQPFLLSGGRLLQDNSHVVCKLDAHAL